MRPELNFYALIVRSVCSTGNNMSCAKVLYNLSKEI